MIDLADDLKDYFLVADAKTVGTPDSAYVFTRITAIKRVEPASRFFIESKIVHREVLVITSDEREL